MFRLTLIATTLAATLATAPVASENTQSNCAERTKMLTLLGEKYGESRQSIGLAANNTVVEVFASMETGTWTIVLTTTEGVSCMMASGQYFEPTNSDLTPVKGELL